MDKKRRLGKRLGIKTGIVLTPNEVCQLTDISPKGFAFKCFNKQYFSRDWPIDVYATSSLSLERLHVNKVWEEPLSNFERSSRYMVKIGVEFKSLTDQQRKQLTEHIRKLEGYGEEV